MQPPSPYPAPAPAPENNVNEQEPDRTNKTAWAIVRYIIVLTVAILAGFFSSYLHPGPRGVQGHVGPQGAQGIQGEQGVPGPAGSAASSQHLGVCVSSSTWTPGGNWPTLLSNVSILSPDTAKDGTVSCSVGSFVPVAPQKP